MLRALTLAFALLASAAQAGERYVSMGSSYAAGLGVAPYQEGAPARCARSTRNYANQLAARRGLTLVDVGCSGARTSAILQPWGELPAQIDAVTADTALVTVTIGGNDIGLVGGLYGASCRQLGEANCAPATTPSEADYAALKTAMTGMVAAIRQRAPKARIVLVEYPTILPPKGSCAATPLSDADADAARAKAARLLAITREAATASDAWVITTSEFSRNHDACAAEPWMNGYPAPGAAPYHPNLAAMTAIAEALDAALR
ncbi:SGNH/GDSL hydrolase family protein [Caulobacter sp.]|uniref:SGNH/GDSL hydrolase family protein n=1 Tax=Caulobacter sp. TaxID=78 RepID=UPI001B0D33F3|nr:SGNH/GDSL hydrolase family protein [Caulobacter sp.]MBO9546525.1 SGNH/GDSL hydrolase family protein [Caulobacter sp.]